MKGSMLKVVPLMATALMALPPQVAQASEDTKHVLMVLSSYGEKNAEGELVKPGYEFDEMSKSYLVLSSAGAEVTFASPNGGKLLADKYDPSKPYNQQFLADKDAVSALESSYKLSDIKAPDYDAVFVVGGKGPMFDLAEDKSVKQIIRTIYENDGVVGAVCHGPAALLDVTLSDGSLLLNGKRVSAFTNEEEAAFTKKWKLPFLLEDSLTEQGAEFHQDGLMLNQVSIDGRLITGQNPFSTADAARAVANQLGLTPDSTLDFKDDRTIRLVEQFYADRIAATEEFKQNQDQYNPMLLGMFGLYQARYADTEVELDVSLQLMHLTQELINHPMLDTAMAKAYLAKSDTKQAKRVLETSLQRHPKNEATASLLQSISQ